MRHIDKEKTTLDVRPRRLHEVLVRNGLLPDEPFPSLTAATELALQRSVDELFQREDWLSAADLVDLLEQELDRAHVAVDRERRAAEKLEESRAALREAETAFADV